MDEDVLPVRDMLVALTAELDQVQALIDESRIRFADDAAFQERLDLQQEELEIRRQRVRMYKIIDDMLNE